MGTLKTLAITLLMTVAAVACGSQADTVRSEGVQPSSASSAGGLSPTTFGNANPNCGPPNESGPATTYGPVSPSSSASPGSSSVDTAQPSPIAPGFGVGQANALKPEYPGNPAAAIRARLPGIQRLSAIANATIDANGNLTIIVGAKGLNEGPDAMRDEWAATVLYGDLLDDVGTNSGSPTRGSWLRSARVVSVADCTEYLLTGTGLGTSVPNGQVFAKNPTLVATVSDALKSFGLRGVDVRIEALTGAALVVVAQVADPTSLVDKITDLERAIAGDPSWVEGYYLEIQLPDGSPIVKETASFRTGVGSQWIRADLFSALDPLHRPAIPSHS
jgi:hypothetical protein